MLNSDAAAHTDRISEVSALLNPATTAQTPAVAESQATLRPFRHTMWAARPALSVES